MLKHNLPSLPSHDEPVTFWRAAAASAGLSVLFLVVYNLTNWISSLRTDVGVWHFEWELGIPFVPLLILPYLSIDLFFVAAPFLCRDRMELRTLAGRIVLAILGAGAGFLIWPLKLGFERPHAEGWFGPAFNFFLTLDKPFNLAPSLHIALLAILSAHYWRHTRGLLRASCQGWFVLVGCSTVLTHQHHLIDIAGGAVLAVVCFYVVADSPWRLPMVKNERIAAYYVSGAGAMFIMSLVQWPAMCVLLWPAIALGLAAAAYSGVGPGIYRKSGGRLPLATRLVLGPLLVGQHLSLIYYRRQCRPWDEVVPGVWIGRALIKRESSAAMDQGVTAVLDLTAEFSEAAPFLTLHYKNLPVLDLTAPTLDQLHESARFIAEQSATGLVYVHCKIGYSRSAATVGAYLLASGRAATVQEAIDRLTQVRPSIVVRPEIWTALRAFHADAAQGCL